MKKHDNIQSKFLNAVAKVGLDFAIKASGTASHFCCFQPREPKALREFKKSK